MDPRGNIYESDDVPVDDKARLDGYLRGRAEADALKAAMEQQKALRAAIRDLDAMDPNDDDA